MFFTIQFVPEPESNRVRTLKGLFSLDISGIINVGDIDITSLLELMYLLNPGCCWVVSLGVPGGKLGDGGDCPEGYVGCELT